MLIGFIALIVVSVLLLTIGFSLFFSANPTTIKSKNRYFRMFLWVLTVALGYIGLTIAVVGLIVNIIFKLVGWI